MSVAETGASGQWEHREYWARAQTAGELQYRVVDIQNDYVTDVLLQNSQLKAYVRCVGVDRGADTRVGSWGPIEGSGYYAEAERFCEARSMRLPREDEIVDAYTHGETKGWREPDRLRMFPYWTSTHVKEPLGPLVAFDNKSGTKTSLSFYNGIGLARCVPKDFRPEWSYHEWSADSNDEYSWEQASRYCDELGFRLPTLSELAMVVEYQNFHFQDIRKWKYLSYWTNEERPKGQAIAALIDGFHYKAIPFGKPARHGVRCHSK